MAAVELSTKEAHVRCPVDKLVPWKDQPRSHASETDAQLVESIRTHGVIEPLIVRRLNYDSFQIIAGERRWRAAQAAGVLEVPIVVREFRDEIEMLSVATAENVGRESLCLADLAGAFKRMREAGVALREVAERVGCSTTHVQTAIASLDLPEAVLDLNRAGQLDDSKLRVLRNIKDPKRAVALAERAVREELTVAVLGRMVMAAPARVKKNGAPSVKKSAGIRDLELRIARRLGLKCTVEHTKSNQCFAMTLSGTLDQLDQLIEDLKV